MVLGSGRSVFNYSQIWWSSLTLFLTLISFTHVIMFQFQVYLIIIHLFGCKRYMRDDFTIFYNNIFIYNLIMCCFPVAFLSNRHSLHNKMWFTYIEITSHGTSSTYFSIKKQNQDLLSHFHLTTIIQLLQSIRSIIFNSIQV